MKGIRVVILLVSLPFGVMSFLLPIYSKEMNMNAVEIGGIFSVFSLVVLLLRPILGKLADKIGYKPLLIGGIVLCAFSFYILAGMGSIVSLYMVRIIQGVAVPLIGISTYGIAIGLSKENKVAEQIGGLAEARMKGILIGSIICFIVTYRGDFLENWHKLFVLYGGVAVIGGMVAFITPCKIGVETKNNDIGDSNLRLSRGSYKLLVISFITAIASSMLSPTLMIYLQDQFTKDLGMLALAFMPSAILCSILPMKLAAISDKCGRIQTLIMGLLISGSVILVIPLTYSLVFLAVLWCIDAVGGLLAEPAEQALFYELVGKKRLGEKYGVYSTVGSLGSVVGPLLGGIIYETISARMVFYIGGIGLIVAAVLVGLLFRNNQLVRGETNDNEALCKRE